MRWSFILPFGEYRVTSPFFRPIVAGPEQDVEVVGHQAVSQQSHLMAFHHLREDALECRIILSDWKIANRALARFRVW